MSVPDPALKPLVLVFMTGNGVFLTRLTIFKPSRAGVKQPTVEVRWKNLFVETDVVVGDRGLPTVMNSYRTFIEVIPRSQPLVLCTHNS